MDAVRSAPDADGDRAAIARIEATGWGLFFLWVGLALLTDVGWGPSLLGTGLIALGVQAARWRQRLPVAWWSVGFGLCLSVAGLAQWLDLPLFKAAWPGWVLPAAFGVLGIAVLVSTWGRRR